MSQYAEVAVRSPIAGSRSFSYSIPERIHIEIGQAVWVPFGKQILQGIVVQITEVPSVEETREIIDVIDPEPVISSERITLAYWMSHYYFCSLFDAISLMLPPGFERRPVANVTRTTRECDSSQLTGDQIKLLDLIGKEKTSIKRLEQIWGKKKTSIIVSKLVNMGLVEKVYCVEPPRIKPKTVEMVALLIPLSQVNETVADLKKKRAFKQAAVLELLAERGIPLTLTEVNKAVGVTRNNINALLKKGFLEVREIQLIRDPVEIKFANIPLPVVLSSDQQTALNIIREETGKNRGSRTVFLLHGVTGSGKTEVYLQALAEIIKQGKKGIALVPEISLTPQTIERFTVRFPGRVAVLHSQLTLGEQFDEWQRIKKGEFDVVIGPRSALFSPQPDLGLIIIDEEHEWTYKQSESVPRYHTRDVALKLAELTGATVILGSATPSVESYYLAETGYYRLLSLPKRVTPEEGAPLPRIEIVDMKQELISGNRSIFSRSLSRAIKEALDRNEQVLLFLNRRGGATFVQCRHCGFVVKCRRCDVSLAFHPDENLLICHQCNYRTAVPLICPKCASKRIKYVGIGTQKVEELAHEEYPSAKILRWDSDAIKSRQDHASFLKKLEERRVDILIGTQMIAKGLDIPSISIVGVINADVSLNLPDFRSGERAFQLLSQVAGRAGRGSKEGRVIIQTYCPEHYSLQAVARQDYVEFYKEEINWRRKLNNPPFTRLVRMSYTHSNDQKCFEEAEKMLNIIIRKRDELGIGGLSIVGPAPYYIPKVRGKYRWTLTLKGQNPVEVLRNTTIPRGWIVDVDPLEVV